MEYENVWPGGEATARLVPSRCVRKVFVFGGEQTVEFGHFPEKHCGFRSEMPWRSQTRIDFWRQSAFWQRNARESLSQGCRVFASGISLRKHIKKERSNARRKPKTTIC